MSSYDLKPLKTTVQEMEKLRERYRRKAEKERKKLEDVYVTVLGEKCYTEEEIMEWYESDQMSCTQCDRYIAKLEKKKEAAGDMSGKTKSENVCEILNDVIYNLNYEIKNILLEEEKERQKQERWKRAWENGMSYQEWLDLEEVNRQSEEYEKMMGWDK